MLGRTAARRADLADGSRSAQDLAAWARGRGRLLHRRAQGRDLYLLKSVLHGRPDEDCLRILGTVRRAMAPGG
ncbi:methyltransferase, partial [Streptomyces albospinus]|uniref:methyltransferase n=1 Tax=Streptomyces albospinus TaxID=285515 RepID=UPI00227D8481